MGIFKNYKENKRDKRKADVVKHSKDLYQLQEYNGEVWMTYDGHLVCPTTMLVDEAVVAIEKMRDMYIERTPKVSVL